MKKINVFLCITIFCFLPFDVFAKAQCSPEVTLEECCGGVGAYTWEQVLYQCPNNYSPHKYWGSCFNCDTEMMLFCPDGQYLSGKICVNCPDGTYSLGEAATHCDPCPSGTWSKDGSVCADCSSINISNGTCTSCTKTGVCQSFVCKGGFSLINGACIYTPLPANCAAGNNGICTQCNAGYSLVSGACAKNKAKCQSPLNLSTDGCCCSLYGG